MMRHRRRRFTPHPAPPAASAAAPNSTGDERNWLRAGVLGANDGIVSTGALVVGVAAVDTARTGAILAAAIAGLLAGAASMALGEYVSVSTERDLTSREPDHAAGADPNPWHAAGASALSFTVGALLPTLAVALAPTPGLRIPVTVVAVLLALVITGYVSATLAHAPRAASIRRVVIGGALALAVTWAAGLLFGVTA